MMIANIRVLEKDGNFHTLCQLDLMKFSVDDVYQRMRQRGIENDNFRVCGFVDWDVDCMMSIGEAYMLKKIVCDLYDGDDSLVRYQLKRHRSLDFVFGHYFKFVTRNEVVLMKRLLKKFSLYMAVDIFFEAGSWENAVQYFINEGIVLHTPKGFYLDSIYL